MSETQQKPQGTPPPPNLMSATSGIWTNWCLKTDREVVREAVLKGFIPLAEEFLSNRNNIDVESTKILINYEVTLMVTDLLARRQVFRAIHILNNLKLDSTEELLKIFKDTTDVELREYIGNHLLEKKQINERNVALWHLLKCIQKSKSSVPQLEGQVRLTIKQLELLDVEEQHRIATTLFFKAYDFALKPLIRAKDAWIWLSSEGVDLLLHWINVYYSSNFCDMYDNVINSLDNLFCDLEISRDMINLITDEALKIPKETQDVILNELSRYAVYNDQDKNDLKAILKRASKSYNIRDFKHIFQLNNSTIDFKRFYEMLIEYCVEHEFYDVLSICTVNSDIPFELVERINSKHLNLIVCMRNTTEKLTNPSILLENIVQTAKYLTKDTLLGYYKTHPVLALATILLSEKCDLKEFFYDNRTISAEDVEITPQFVYDNFYVINAVQNRPQSEVTYTELVNRHTNIDTDSLFNFRKDDTLFPHFNSPILSNNFGLKNRLDCQYYLKKGRPSVATKIFLVETLTNKIKKKETLQKISQSMDANYLDREYVASCIAFFEMLGENSNDVRVHFKIADLIHEWTKKKNVELEYKLDFVHTDPGAILNTLELILADQFTPNFDLIPTIRRCEVARKFSRIHNLPLPEAFLKFCAQTNSWLPFLIYVQIHNYPLKQTLKLVEWFESQNLVEHLHQALSIKGDLTEELDEDQEEGEPVLIKTDVLDVFVRCHRSGDPPNALLLAAHTYRYPTFAVLAACYEPDSVIVNFLTWLSVSCNMDDEFYNCEAISISGDLMMNFLKNAIFKGYHRTLKNSFNIFLPHNALEPFITMLSQCIELDFDESAIKTLLEEFKTRLNSLQATAIVESDYEMSYLGSRIWAEKATVLLLTSGLQFGFDSEHAVLKFLKLLLKLSFIDILTIYDVDFDQILKLVECLYSAKTSIHFNYFAFFDAVDRRNDIMQCIDALMTQKRYETALKLATIELIKPDFIFLHEWQNKFDNDFHGNFWEECNNIFTAASIQPEAAVEFFLTNSFKIEGKEKFKALKLAYDWAEAGKLESLHRIEKYMWFTYISTNDCKFESRRPKKMLYSEMQEELKNLKEGFDSSIITTKQLVNLEKAIDALLESENFFQALRLQKIIQCHHLDLEILKLCLTVAEAIKMPYELTSEERKLISKKPNPKKRNIQKKQFSSSLIVLTPPSSKIINSASSDGDVSQITDTVTIMTILMDRLCCGEKIALKAILTYKICISIETSYANVFRIQKCVELLNAIAEVPLETPRLSVMRYVIHLFEWTDEMVANFLWGVMLQAIKKTATEQTTEVTLWKLNLNVDFHLILEFLPQNTTILGAKMYVYAEELFLKITNSTSEIKSEELFTLIEVLIFAHECFTTDCNMKGIIRVLNKVRLIISRLLVENDWNSMGRLLTGIKRYTEMMYVIDIFKENDYFEVLLKQGSAKDHGLKLALIDYLKKYCPERHDLFEMVAAHFPLHSEVAQIMDNEAKGIIKNLIKISKLEMHNNGVAIPDNEPFVLLTNTETNSICLSKAMENYRQVAEYHVNGGKLNKAMKVAKQAELVALQLSLLKGSAQNATVTCILNLTRTQISTLIYRMFGFPESLLLAEAYDFTPDWATALFEQYVLRNHSNYFEHFLHSLPLTESLVQDIARIYSRANPTAVSIRNMKEIVSKCESVEGKYIIARELEFSDVIDNILSQDEFAYLKDKVEKENKK